MSEKETIHFRTSFLYNRNHLRSLIYQSYLQTAAPTEKYMFDKSHFKIQSVRIISQLFLFSNCLRFRSKFLPMVQEFFKQPTGQRDIANADQVTMIFSRISLRISW